MDKRVWLKNAPQRPAKWFLKLGIKKKTHQNYSKMKILFLIKTNRKIKDFFAKNRFSVDFWGSPGSPGISRDVPGASQNRSFFSLMFHCAWKRGRAASRRLQEVRKPQEASGGPRRLQEASGGSRRRHEVRGTYGYIVVASVAIRHAKVAGSIPSATRKGEKHAHARTHTHTRARTHTQTHSHGTTPYDTTRCRTMR